jgi:hypothetical protein
VVLEPSAAVAESIVLTGTQVASNRSRAPLLTAEPSALLERIDAGANVERPMKGTPPS